MNCTRLGGQTNCGIVGSTVTCSSTLTTGLFDNSVPQQDMLPFLQRDALDLQEDVYAIRPPYYRSISSTASSTRKARS